MFIIRFVFYFSLSFAIMCIPIGDNQLVFNKLQSLVSPYAKDVIKTTKQKISSTKKYSKKLYSNSEPEAEFDQVNESMAGIKRDEVLHDTYNESEQERLRKVLSEE